MKTLKDYQQESIKNMKSKATMELNVGFGKPNKGETKLEAICNNAISSAISHYQEWKNVDGFYDILLSIEKTLPAKESNARKIVVEINGKGYTIKTIYQHLVSKLNRDNFSKILFNNRSNIRVTIV